MAVRLSGEHMFESPVPSHAIFQASFALKRMLRLCRGQLEARPSDNARKRRNVVNTHLLNAARQCVVWSGCAILLASPTLAADAPPAMSVPGSFAVTPSGAATYSIPILVPPGTAGLVPSLSLDYSSKSGDGIVGLGWMLSGLQSIEHCPRTIAQDGVHGAVNFDTNDRFCLDGARLVPIGNGEYRTELESFSKIMSYGTTGNGPTYFKVWTKAGQIIEFGNTTDSRLLAVGKTTVRIWAVNKMSDAKGNYYTVTYKNDTTNGQIYPLHIDYTGNASSHPAVTPYNSVKFCYDPTCAAPATRPDVVPAYQAGSLQQTTVLLQDIKTYQGSNLVYDYNLDYRAGTSTLHSRLTSVTLCDASGANCLAPTTFGWQGGSGTFTTNSVSDNLAPGATRQPGDFNGDGLTDFVAVPGCIYLGQPNGTFVLSSMTMTFGGGSPYSACFTAPPNYLEFVTDLNGDGVSDIVQLVLQQYNQYTSAYPGYSYVNDLAGNLASNGTQTTGAGPGQAFLTGDFNGDGISDFNGSIPIYYGTPPVADDFNGDGCADIYTLGPSSIYTILYSCSSTSVQLPDWSSYKVTYADFNGDGKTDFLVANASGSTLYLSTGTGITAGYSVPQLTATSAPLNACDFDGNGRADIAVTTGSNTTIWLSTGTGFVQGPTVSGTSGKVCGDWNSDGAPELQIGNGTTDTYLNYAPELMTTISNGLGSTTTVTYDRINKNGTFYAKGTNASYPMRDVDGPFYEVSKVTATNGIGGSHVTTYTYAGLEADQQGRGLLGFSSVTATDSSTTVAQTTNYRTDFPFIGAIASQTVTAPATGGGTVTVRTTTNTWADTNLGAGTDGVVRHYTSLTKSVVASNDLDGTALPTTTTNYTYDAYGNALTVNAAVTGGSYKNVTNTYNNDTTNWFIGQLASATVVSHVTYSTITRTSCFTYEPTTGLLSREVIEPVSTTNCVYSSTGLQTDYVYDDFGHRQSETVSGPDITTRTKTTDFDALGQFQTQGCNALNQCENYTYDPRFGGRATAQDVNGLTTSWTYDPLGRPTLETRPDGNQTVFTYVYCNGVNGGTASCPSRGAVYQEATPENAAGTQNGPIAMAIYDYLGRKLYDQAQGFNSAWIRTATQYDVNGRVAQTSRPYFTAGGTAVWTVNSYDALGRVTLRTFPNGASQTIAYDGLSSSVTTDLGQTTTTVKNAQGLVASVTDALGNTTSYLYNAYGQLKQVTDPVGNVVVNAWDVRGNKTAMTDPDLGHWTYQHNSLGELTSQTDAKHKTTTLTYDLAGRLTNRTESGLVSTWTFGTSAPDHNVGMLIEAEACTTTACTTIVSDRTYFYDSLGRPSSNTLATGGGNYTYGQTYNGDGRLATVAYPSGFTAAYYYTNSGYLYYIKDSANGKVYWKVTSRDAELHALGQTFGNTVTQTNTYDPNSGLLTNVRAGPSDSVAAFDYAYDTANNLTYRSDNFEGVFEYDCYDALNRLRHYAVGNTATSCTSTPYKTMAYDALGNITYKPGLSYTYPAAGSAQPHAVSSITGTVNGVTNPTYVYDANGNMTTGAGMTITPTAFNMAASIVDGGTTVSLTYDSEHQRLTMTTPSATTTYLNDPTSGAMEEKVVASGSTTWHDYIQADGHFAAEKFSGATSAVRYFVVDHLGSIAVATDENGTVVERDAYDAWGRRRNLDGSADNTCSLTSLTTRGFTGHEHIDSECLINANARMYDPTIGRFMSPDEIVPNPYDQQSYNRYSYVNNRPLSFTDPTGHDCSGSGDGGGLSGEDCTGDFENEPVFVNGIETVVVNGIETDPGYLIPCCGLTYYIPASALDFLSFGGSEIFQESQSFGTSAAGLGDAVASSTAPSGPSGGSKNGNNLHNVTHYWRLTTYHQNADGSTTITVQYVQGTLDDDNYIDVAKNFGGFAINVEVAPASCAATYFKAYPSGIGRIGGGTFSEDQPLVIRTDAKNGYQYLIEGTAYNMTILGDDDAFSKFGLPIFQGIGDFTVTDTQNNQQTQEGTFGLSIGAGHDTIITISGLPESDSGYPVGVEFTFSEAEGGPEGGGVVTLYRIK
jgi:RHS repeat-associated protein